MSSNKSAVVVKGLRKRYEGRYALDGFDLTVPQATVSALLGPNGAGKTTAVRILATLLRFDAGTATVAGFDVARQPAQVRARIGLVGQHAAVDEILSGQQNLVMFGRLFHLSARQAARRAADLLEQFDLADTGDRPLATYSGGMRRRLDLAASMILAPTVLFLDEPTVGLDPRGRSEVWQSIRDLVTFGTSVLLTTQYLDEADQLANHIDIIDTGKVVAGGTPSQLKAQLGGDRIEFIVHHRFQVGRAAAAVSRLGVAEPAVDLDTRQVSLRVSDKATALSAAVRALDEAAISFDDLTLRRPTLDEVFLHLTGGRAEQEATA
ncbi:daunorubicin resistance protein DrrA family ABC transporter ATP-binding protein [Nocardia sp. CNY236]|uniref:daunorubicin resistance protein DrrA family ABC transporter ATP-binding protein n=1 Tax=Nocardia sp. CNY236 TaxID=1169152 RepID=UPI00048F13A5|nr:daunorubicin resistance protein DrrA family ABC transporter ATP-binding protein [Nocardia sp. CNY236]